MAIVVLSYLMREKTLKVLFLMETKQFMEEMLSIQADLPYCCMLVVPSLGRRGGLALLWMEKVDLHVQTNSSNHIDAFISNDNSLWRLTRFYGWLEEQRKRESW